MNRSNPGIFPFIAALLLMISCSLTSAPPTTQQQPAQTETVIEATPTQEPTELPTEIPPAAVIEHLVTPGEPTGSRAFLTDVNSSSIGQEGRAVSGDNYGRNRFERPFTSEEMTYRPDLDITRGNFTLDEQFFYFTLTVAGAGPGDAFPGTYGVELDFDSDGRGDWLVLASAPEQSWSTDRVQILIDSNEDIGGTTPVLADATLASGNGFDQVFFDSGVGDDPDSAWARRNPDDPLQIELALKRDVADDASFLWGLWADDGLVSPALFDYVDRIAEADAGSPLRDSDFYPLGEVAALDNTCRSYHGFTPTGQEPGICLVFGTVQNCTFHPMMMVPGNVIIGPQNTDSAIKSDVSPGTYGFYDQNVLDNNNNHPLVLTATISANGLVQIMTDGNGNTYPCP